MDNISGLPDELLIKILLFLPTKAAVSTSVLSKRWECLWMWLPKLEFVRGSRNLAEWEKLRCFLNRNLPLHKAPVIETFCLYSVWSDFNPEDIEQWLLTAISRQVRHLKISYRSYPLQPDVLPSSLYTCKSLVTLKLLGEILLVVPHMGCLPSLKTLHLQGNRYLDAETLQGLLSISPVLEDLCLKIGPLNMGTITVIIPTLQILSLYIPRDSYVDKIVIKTPSLKYFKLVDHSNEILPYLIEVMPNLEEAYVDVTTFPDIDCIIRSIISVKRLTIHSEAVYSDGFVFNRLERLSLFVRRLYCSNLLVPLLKDSPNLQGLDLYERKDHGFKGLVRWKEPSSVPECMVSSLEIFSWSKYYGRPQARDLAVYILKNACCLKTATISSDERFVPKLEMFEELSLSPRASAACQLVFN